MQKIWKRIFYPPAKINLTLEVVGKRADGYHLLRTVMLKLPKLRDRLVLMISSVSKMEIILKSNQKSIPLDEKNTCYRATQLFLEKINQKAKVEITLTKKIPFGAGLGGGSSDAAMTLLGLSQFFRKSLSKEQLISLASDVGKDVPFFLEEKEAALMTGLGDKREKSWSFKERFFVLVVKPPENVSTALAYGGLAEKMWFLKKKQRFNWSASLANKSVQKKSEIILSNSLYNDFEITIERQLPIIKEIKQSLLAFGAEGALMSGSGSTVFGIFSSLPKLERVQKIFKKHYSNFFVARGR
mgnify:CR=1 FL=1